jgi:2-polyprenyl-6-hydroxyphenyl methylase/3-demethylubiquinone-9 3-methyltransferase
VTGVDPSESAIAAARRHAEANDLEIDYLVGRGERLPFGNGVYDIVVCVDVLEHVKDLNRVIAEIRRVLNPHGLLLFDTINRTWIASFLMVTIGENIIRLLPRGAHDPALFIRPQELARNLEVAGFDVGRFVGMGPCGLNRRFDFVFRLLATTAVQYLGAARAKR